MEKGESCCHVSRETFKEYLFFILLYFSIFFYNKQEKRNIRRILYFAAFLP